MRTIKFRGKDIATKEWVYGFYTQGGFVNPDDGTATVRHIVDNEILHDVIPETVSQFTGLFDKNGNEIYEGDILLWTRKNVYIVGRPIRDLLYKCIIYYDNDKCGFMFRCKLNFGSCVGNLDFSDVRAKESYIEVIGNKWDNTEIL